MNCLKIKEKISSYIDNELDSEQSKYVGQHLLHCHVCREELKLLQQVDAAFKEMPVYSPSAQFSARLMRQIAKEAVLPERDGFKYNMFLHPLKFFEKFYNLLNTQRVLRTATLDEFSDFPPCSISYIYFKLFAIKQ
ncbi:MAG: zf-HC2 domain-containing protein [Desulfobacterales bacterium]|nr:zf-HC2 domain-containing protein [Desulfobacterales bacterium]